MASLLEPIPGDSPTGVDIRGDVSPTSIYYAIKDARNAARGTERAAQADGIEASGGMAPEWKTVLDLGPGILREQSKDVEVAAWLVEALVRQKGFAGLRDGVRLVKGLVEGFWDGLYPMPDEDGIATRVGPLAGLNGEDAEGTLITPILMVEVTRGSSVGPYATWQYQQALELQRIADPERMQRRIEAGALTMETFEKAVRETPPEFFRRVHTDATTALEEYHALSAALDEKCGSYAPPAGNIRTALQACIDGLNYFARHALEAAPAEGAEDAAGEPGGIPTAGPAGGGGPGGPPQTREQAFRVLEEVATFFRRTEPHSPLSFSLDQAVRWGRMSLPELLAELIPDETARGTYQKLTGIRGEGGSG